MLQYMAPTWDRGPSRGRQERAEKAAIEENIMFDAGSIIVFMIAGLTILLIMAVRKI